MDMDPQVEAFLRPFQAPDNALESQPLEQARANYRQLFSESALVAPSVRRSDRNCPGTKRDIPCRLYQPLESTGTPRTLLVYLHGGGGVLGDVESYDALLAWLCHYGNRMVLFVDYCLAPEYPFPQGIMECHVALNWAAQQAESWGAIPDRIALMGDSTGGSFCNACSLLARDPNVADVDAQFLLYPVLDLRQDCEYVSRQQFGDGRYFLGNAGIDWSREHYLTDLEQQCNPMASALCEADLGSLPPTLILTAELDPLRDEGEAYAEALRASGVPAVYHCAKQAIHGFISFSGKLDLGLTNLYWLLDQMELMLPSQTVNR